jgi:hypothetical protein
LFVTSPAVFEFEFKSLTHLHTHISISATSKEMMKDFCPLQGKDVPWVSFEKVQSPQGTGAVPATLLWQQLLPAGLHSLFSAKNIFRTPVTSLNYPRQEPCSFSRKLKSSFLSFLPTKSQQVIYLSTIHHSRVELSFLVSRSYSPFEVLP